MWPVTTEFPRPASAGGAEVEIGFATNADLAAIVEILNHAAATSTARFESEPVTVHQRRGWFMQFTPAGPHRCLIARREGRVAGYACAQRYRDLDAFRETVEVSIALVPGSRGQGIGTALYAALFGQLDRDPSVHMALAGIALPNPASVALHRRFGFAEVGIFREYAVKDGQYISSLWMQRFCPPATAPTMPPATAPATAPATPPSTAAGEHAE